MYTCTFVYIQEKLTRFRQTMNVVTDMIGARVTTASSAQQTPAASCTAALDTTDIRSGLHEGDERRGQAHPICRSSSPRPSNGLTFARRRHSKSVDSPYLSRPRMKRRGAISYDKNDAAAEYIRYLDEMPGVPLQDLRHGEGGLGRMYHCDVWFTHAVSLCVLILV